MRKFIDLTGKSFGKWGVIKKVENNKNGKAKWLCKCVCGNEKKVLGFTLINGDSTSCGCNTRLIDLTGRKFGRLIVIKRVGKNKWGSIIWLCKCACGNIKKVFGDKLRNGGTKSCGCFQKEWRSNYNKIEPGLAAKNEVYYNYKKNSKVKNFLFELSFDDFINLSQKNCWYCGSELSNIHKGHGNGGFKYNGIDRKDNNIGYTIENSVSCCKHCNYMKKDLEYDKFLSWIKGVYLNRINI